MSAAPLPERPLLSAVVVTHDSGDCTFACVRSVFREAEAEGILAEVLVVDNASRDGLVDRLEQGLPRVRVLRNPRNLGFGAAANQGFRAARGRRVLLLNPDAELLPGSLGPLLRSVDEGAALAAPRLLLPDGRTQESPRRFYSMETVVARRTPWGRTRSGARARQEHLLSPAAPTDVDWVPGAAMLLDPAAMPSAGPFDPRYFLYFEDVDLCRRLRAQGLRVEFRPDSTVAHAFGGGSRRQVPWNPLLWSHLASGLAFAVRWSSGRWRSRWWRSAAGRVLALLGRVGVLGAVAVGLGAVGGPVPLGGVVLACVLGGLVTPGPSAGAVGRPSLPGVADSAGRLVLAGLASLGALLVAEAAFTRTATALPAGSSLLVASAAWAVAGAVSLRVLRRLRRATERALRRRGVGRRAVLLAGDAVAARRVAQALAEDPGAGLDAVGYLFRDGETGGPTPRLADWSEAVGLAERLRVDGVVLAGSPETLSRMAGGVARLRDRGIPAAFALTGPVELLQPEVGERVAGLPILPLGPGPEAPSLARVEQAGQRVVSALALALLALPALPVLLLLRLRFAASPFVALPRLGRDLRPFSMWRLRSGGGPDGDQDGGRVGALLRRLHLDELPQLYNVARGEMALVGPRPIDAETAARLDPWERARFRVSPGITGMWQLDRLRRWRLEQMIASDLLYLLRWSPALDLRILGETLLGRRNP